MKKTRRYLGGLIASTVILNISILVLLWFLYKNENQINGSLRLIIIVILMILVIDVVLLLFLLGRKIYKNNFEQNRRLKDVTEQADSLTREVVANITHDLKTPLTAINGYSQGILDGIAGTPEQITKYVTTIRNKANDMAVLVDELSFFTQIYQNDIRYNFRDVNANTYLCECVSELSLDLEMKKISLIYQNVADKNIRIYVDMERMKRVLNNVIGNSSKYINSDMGIVLVHIGETKENLVVQITDNGIGIEEEELPHIFERFYRADSSRSSKTGGSGLGLAIARKIIEDHNGEIWAESEIGKGTRISFTLPKIEAGAKTYTTLKENKGRKHEKNTDY